MYDIAHNLFSIRVSSQGVEMRITRTDNITFTGYSFKLKKLYREGKLPKDLVDIGGNKLTNKNLSGDHAIPRSKGGKTTDSNMMLATKQFNSLRGNRPLREVTTIDNLIKWVNQYIELEPIEGFDFRQYVRGILNIIEGNNV